jgi:hypothetical protein
MTAENLRSLALDFSPSPSCQERITYAAVAVNISTLEVPPVKNMSPPAKTTVKRAIIPSTLAFVWSLESTVMAAIGRTQATMVATEEVNSIIRCSENVLRVVTFLQEHGVFCRLVDFPTSRCSMFSLSFHHSQSFCQKGVARSSSEKGAHSLATQRVRPSTL